MKNTLVIALVLMFSMVGSTVIAGNVNDKNPATEADVRHTGSTSTQYVFLAEVNNPSKNLVRISVLDEDGNEYFSETLREKKMQKQLLIEKDLLQERNLVIEIYTLKSKRPLVYKIAKQVKVIQELQVEKIDVK